jgi:hypothetical protein
MPIAFDAASGGQTAGATSVTYSHTCSSGVNRALFVGVFSDDSGDNLTGITYAGVAMTLIDKQDHTDGSFPGYTYLYYLSNPASGANNVVVSYSGSHVIRSSSASYTGVSLAIPDNKTKGSASGANALTLSLTPVANNCWTIMVIGSYQNASASTNFTSRNAQSSREMLGDSNGAITPPASFGMTVTSSGNAYVRGVMASFAPSTPSGFMLMF